MRCSAILLCYLSQVANNELAPSPLAFIRFILNFLSSVRSSLRGSLLWHLQENLCFLQHPIWWASEHLNIWASEHPIWWAMILYIRQAKGTLQARSRGWPHLWLDMILFVFWLNCVTQLKLYNGDKLSSTIWLIVRCWGKSSLVCQQKSDAL